MRFVDTHVFRHHRFSLGIDRQTGGHYISLPVSGFNRAAEYEAHFTISAAEHAVFAVDPEAAATLVAALLEAPGGLRRII